jgi:hypothetical protein
LNFAGCRINCNYGAMPQWQMKARPSVDLVIVIVDLNGVQTLRIKRIDRIRLDVRIGIDPAVQADGIAFQISSDRRVVVPEPINVETGFTIKNLAGKT